MEQRVAAGARAREARLGGIAAPATPALPPPPLPPLAPLPHLQHGGRCDLAPVYRVHLLLALLRARLRAGDALRDLVLVWHVDRRRVVPDRPRRSEALLHAPTDVRDGPFGHQATYSEFFYLSDAHVNTACKLVHAALCLAVNATWSSSAILSAHGSYSWQKARLVYLCDGLSFLITTIPLSHLGLPPAYSPGNVAYPTALFRAAISIFWAAILTKSNRSDAPRLPTVSVGTMSLSTSQRFISRLSQARRATRARTQTLAIHRRLSTAPARAKGLAAMGSSYRTYRRGRDRRSPSFSRGGNQVVVEVEDHQRW